MREFVPLYESLYDNEKLGMSHGARSVYVGLCLKSRKDKGDRVRLPRGEQSLAQGVWRLLGGKVTEVEEALVELQDPSDPMIRVEGQEGHFLIVLLASARWQLQGRGESVDESHRSSAAIRQARYRNRKAGIVTAPAAPERDGPPSQGHNAPRNDPHNTDRNSERNAMGGKGGSLAETSERKEEKREEVVEARVTDDHNSERNTNIVTQRHAPSRTAPGLVATLRSHPELAEYEPGGMLKLEEVARNLRGVADNYVMGGKVREDEVRERVEWAISEVAREVRSANQTASPLAGGKVAKKLEMFAKTNLGKSREQWEADRGLREGRPSPRPGAAPLPPPPRKPNPQGLADMIAAKRAE